VLTAEALHTVPPEARWYSLDTSSSSSSSTSTSTAAAATAAAAADDAPEVKVALQITVRVRAPTHAASLPADACIAVAMCSRIRHRVRASVCGDGAWDSGCWCMI
jgi:hypothetical protein